MTRIGPTASRMELTQKELNVLALVVEGLSTRKVAEKLWLAEQTIKFHKTNIYQKLNVHNPVELLIKSVELGLVPCPCGSEIKHDVTINGKKYILEDK